MASLDKILMQQKILDYKKQINCTRLHTCKSSGVNILILNNGWQYISGADILRVNNLKN